MGHGASSPLALSRVPSIDINVETAVDKFAEQVAVTPEFGNSPRKGTDLPTPPPLSTTPSSGPLQAGRGGPSPHPPATATPSGGGQGGVEAAFLSRPPPFFFFFRPLLLTIDFSMSAKSSSSASASAASSSRLRLLFARVSRAAVAPPRPEAPADLSA